MGKKFERELRGRMISLEELEEWKKKRDAVILAHYYVRPEVQALADYIGDSYFLSKKATELANKTIVLCGVTFMGESAKLLNPDKTVLMPDLAADCPMAHMADVETIRKMRKEYDDLAVVCYINSTAEIKAHSDVCVTSSNALKVVTALPQKNIFFVPDENLGRYIGSKLPEKNFIYNDGFCHVHRSITAENVKKAKEVHPEAEVLVHPECTPDVVALGDYVGSTSGIIDYATASDKDVFIICTEMGVLYELKQKNPGKTFYSVGHRQFCPNMKRISLENVRDTLRDMKNQVELPEDLRLNAKKALDEMLRIAQ